MKRTFFISALLLGACTTPAPAPDPSNGTATPNVVIRYDDIHHGVHANAGMVVSQNFIATQVGQAVLRSGGNAVDAAVAVGFALAVTLPRAGNVGGSGFMIVHDAATGQQTAYDFRSAMPASFDPEQHRNADGSMDLESLKYGAGAAAVPGTVAGLHAAWQRFGSRSWQQLVRPALQLAKDGIEVWPDLAFALATEQPVFEQFPSSQAVFMRDGATFEPGNRWRQPDLAWTLEQIGKEGARAFYRGAIADRIVRSMEMDGGHITREDLAAYRVRERTPLRADYRGNTVVTMPPVSGGGITLLQMLGALSHFDVAQFPQGSAASLHLLAEVMKQGAANRRVGIGDPDFASIDVEHLLSPQLTSQMAEGINLKKARRIEDVRPLNDSSNESSNEPSNEPTESRETTHYSVVDQWGNAVSTTYTLGYSFGSGYVARGTGVLLDNQLRNFTYDPPNHANGPAAGKRMMSTMTPTLVLDPDGEVVLVSGTPGGGRIVNIMLQVLVNVMDYGMSIAAATHAPRIHQPWRSQALGVEAIVPARHRAGAAEHGPRNRRAGNHGQHTVDRHPRRPPGRRSRPQKAGRARSWRATRVRRAHCTTAVILPTVTGCGAQNDRRASSGDDPRSLPLSPAWPG